MVKEKDLVVYDGLLVGQNIRNLRIKKGLSIGELSDDVGKSESHMKQVELGSRKISLDLLLSLMTVLETGANDILAYDKEETKQVSIDSQLKSLPEKQRNYLTNIFQSMIEEYPVVA